MASEKGVANSGDMLALTVSTEDLDGFSAELSALCELWDSWELQLDPLGRDDGWNFSSLHCEKTTEGAVSRPCGTAPPLVGSSNADLAAAAPRMDCVAGRGRLRSGSVAGKGRGGGRGEGKTDLSPTTV